MQLFWFSILSRINLFLYDKDVNFFLQIVLSIQVVDCKDLSFNEFILCMNQFYEDIFAIVRLIPKGRVTSYGAIANALGKGGAARQVGYAMHQAPDDVPAHRVLNRNGDLSGKLHFGGNRMQ